MIFRCMRKCMESDEPCEFTYREMEKLMSKTTPCPLGENNYFDEVDEDNEFFCVIVGTRTYQDYQEFKFIVDHMLPQNEDLHIVIVSGGAKGADELAERYAKEKQYELIIFKANWELDGKSAGYLRNERMHKYIARKRKRGVIAFWDGLSRGTEHSLRLSKKYENPIKVYLYKEKRFKKDGI